MQYLPPQLHPSRRETIGYPISTRRQGWLWQSDRLSCRWDHDSRIHRALTTAVIFSTWLWSILVYPNGMGRSHQLFKLIIILCNVARQTISNHEWFMTLSLPHYPGRTTTLPSGNQTWRVGKWTIPT